MYCLCAGLSCYEGWAMLYPKPRQHVMPCRDFFKASRMIRQKDLMPGSAPGMRSWLDRTAQGLESLADMHIKLVLSFVVRVTLHDSRP